MQLDTVYTISLVLNGSEYQDVFQLVTFGTLSLTDSTKQDNRNSNHLPFITVFLATKISVKGMGRREGIV